MTPETEERVATGGYPQLNLNTGVSISAVALLIGMVIWSAGIKSEVGYHEQRLAVAESTIKELRASVDNYRYLQSQSDIKLEGRLVGIESLLRDVIARLAAAERDRRGSGP